MELRHHALEALCLADPERKARQTLHMHAHPDFSIDPHLELTPPPGTALPGLPERPELRPHTEMARRSPATPLGRAVLIHAIAHIEYSAINLALDAIWRFANMPHAFYRDWLRIAAEEAKHFNLLRAHLRSQGYDYGDFPAHQGQWTMCEKTKDDIVARMALVPRTMEARGLDATPQIQAKLRQVGSSDALAAVEILDLILREEIGHVAIGNHWYRWLCAREGLDPEAHYIELTHRYEAPRMRPPFNLPARRAAGFSESELHWLEQNRTGPHQNT